jgi:hypothetical protein
MIPFESTEKSSFMTRMLSASSDMTRIFFVSGMYRMRDTFLVASSTESLMCRSSAYSIVYSFSTSVAVSLPLLPRECSPAQCGVCMCVYMCVCVCVCVCVYVCVCVCMCVGDSVSELFSIQ